ncbi:MAG: hypothetical protein R3338_06640, partial [Thermoanaerobaculia bacterium]|nr:hypothetical protein [Thermoanaerobaculia bacterium]
EDLVRHTYTAPLHDIRQEKERVLSRLDRFAERLGSEGPLAQGPGHYVIGKVLLDLRDYERAAEHLDRAWKSGYERPEVAFARGYVNGAIYHRELQRVDRIPDPKSRIERRKELEQTYRRAVVESLQASQGIQSESPALLDALIAFYDGRWEDSLEHAENVQQSFPWQYEARLIEARIHAFLGNQDRDAGNYLAADQHYADSNDAWQEAIEIGRSDPLLHQGRCALWTDVARLQSWFGTDSREALSTAIASCDRALEADPALTAALVNKADAMIQLAVEQRSASLDASETLASASDLARQASELDPDDASARYFASLARWWVAVEEFRRGEDPRPSLSKVIESLERTIEMDPTHGFAYDGLGNAYLLRSDYESQQGKPSTEKDLRSAIDAFTTAAELRPTFVSFNNLAYAYLHMAREQADPTRALEKAVQSADEAVRLNPDLAVPHVARATALCRLAEHRIDLNSDPEPHLSLAAKAIERAIEIDRGYWESHMVAGMVGLARAEWRRLNGLDPGDDLDRSREELLEANRLNPGETLVEEQFSRLDRIASRPVLVPNRSRSVARGGAGR